MRHLLEIDDLTAGELNDIIAIGRSEQTSPVLQGKGVACYFEKPSARTRNSTEMAVVQLGGHPVYITDPEVGIDTRETAEDVTRTLACFHQVICARVFDHSVLERMVATNVVPVVNLLSDESHPLQAIADVFTILDEFGLSQDVAQPLAGRVITYVGDANNVARSLALAVGLLGAEFRIASPPDYSFSEVDLDRIRLTGATIVAADRVAEVAPGSDVIYADTWTSMGQEEEHAKRMRDFEGFQVDDAMLNLAGSKSIFMHCLPAHRGEEVTDEALDGKSSRIWKQAAHRLTSARSVLAWLESQR